MNPFVYLKCLKTGDTSEKSKDYKHGTDEIILFEYGIFSWSNIYLKTLPYI